MKVPCTKNFFTTFICLPNFRTKNYYFISLQSKIKVHNSEIIFALCLNPVWPFRLSALARKIPLFSLRRGDRNNSGNARLVFPWFVRARGDVHSRKARLPWNPPLDSPNSSRCDRFAYVRIRRSRRWLWSVFGRTKKWHVWTTAFFHYSVSILDSRPLTSCCTLN